MFLRRKATPAMPDEDLVLALRDGHQPALGHLWDRYAHLLLGVGMKYLKDDDLARDLVVDLFATLPDLLKKHQVERFRPWVHTVMRNRCLLALRSAKHAAPLPEELLVGADPADEEDALLHEHTLQRLEAAIEQLNDAQRACIRFFHLERQSYQQVAQRTGLQVEEVRSHLQNGRRNLRIILTQHADQNA